MLSEKVLVKALALGGKPLILFLVSVLIIPTVIAIYSIERVMPTVERIGQRMLVFEKLQAAESQCSATTLANRTIWFKALLNANRQGSKVNPKILPMLEPPCIQATLTSTRLQED